MRIISWNINSIRLRKDQVLKILLQKKPDILCLQECKCLSEQMPFDEFKPLGYNYCVSWGQKSYNGVAIISKLPISSVERKDFLSSEHARHISIKIGNGISLHNFYFPAGGDIPDRVLNEKFDFKLKYIEAVKNFFEFNKTRKSILVGDLNIAPGENDVWDHKKLLNVVSHTPLEVRVFEDLKKTSHWVDVFRQKYPNEKIFSWWSYRAKNWRESNRGRRLDHIWITPDLLSYFEDCWIDYEVRNWSSPSDHAPISLDLNT